MPPDPVAVVKANNNAFSRMDVDAMLAFYAPDAEVSIAAGSPSARSAATTSCAPTT